ncbi:hypothetical protein [Pseudomonas viridiflava]|uniref:hypothetical protein n=1 Tax=Pseudomonas viridiflava TaxID=33069 RepID=UPI000F06A91B|nr:hypothetical protein [Pseudomonas viridiflava]
MNKLAASEQARQIVDASRVAFQGMTGAVLSFASLARLLNEPDTKKLALAVEILASKEVHLLERIYFFEDENYGLLKVPKDEVNSYVITGLFYHPITRIELDSDCVDDHIFIEFEVL